MADSTNPSHPSKRLRSRSPEREHRSSHRVRSPHRHHHRSHHSSRSEKKKVVEPVLLPYNARQLGKRDYETFRPMFASYLDIQKDKYIEDMDEAEAKGRWKSFVGKWNRSELAEGWYDPATLSKAIAAEKEEDLAPSREREFPSPPARPHDRTREYEAFDASESDDSVGPALPGQQPKSRNSRMGPSVPSMQDLEIRRETQQEEHEASRTSMREDRKYDRKLQKEQLNELVPRAEAGTRERQLEKKAEVNATMKSFRDRSPGAALEVPDSELMGGGDGVSEFKKQKQDFERKKNERELRKEEIMRARAAEREERLSEYRVKEEGTMAMLQALAKQRFG